MIDDFNQSMEGQVQQMGDWLWAVSRVPTNGELLIFPLPPMGASWHNVPQGTIECHGNW